MSREILCFSFSFSRGLVAFFVAPLVLTACGSDSKGDAPVVCTVTPPLECVEPAPHYADVAPIFELRCATAACHSGFVGGPWPLRDYEHIADWQDEVRSEVLHCTMPPSDSGMTMSDVERQTILAWIKCGHLE